MKTIAVTGANGFVGRRFCQLLDERGYRVIALVRDNPQSGVLPLQAIVKVLGRNIDRAQLSQALSGADCCVHLISRAHITNENPGQAATQDHFDSTFKLTDSLLQACRDAGIKRFLFMSSAMAAALTSDAVLTEDSPLLPQTPYGKVKLQTERLVEDFCRAAKIAWVIIRPPLVYGPGVKANMLSLFKLAQKGWPLPLGAVNNRRSFVYLDNLVEASIAALEEDRASNNIFFVSDDEVVSTPQLLRVISRGLDKKSIIFSVPVTVLKAIAFIADGFLRLLGKDNRPCSGMVGRLVGSLEISNAKIKKYTSWRPQYGLQEGIDITARWYRSKFF